MMAMAKGTDIDMLGKGIYSLRDASKYAQVPLPTLTRWLKGYRFPTKYRGGDKPPLFQSQIPEIDGRLGLGFLDLVEVLFIKAFRERGVTLQNIRRAAEKAARIWKTDHPFSLQRLKTDGLHVFADIKSDDGDAGLLNLTQSQWTFKGVITPYLRQVEYDQLNGIALRWWPLKSSRSVVIDPRYAFGKPVVLPGHVPTESIYSAVQAEEDERAVARWLDLPLSAIRAAVAFEESRAA